MWCLMAGMWGQARQAARAAGEAWQHYTNESYWYMALGRALRDSGLRNRDSGWRDAEALEEFELLLTKVEAQGAVVCGAMAEYEEAETVRRAAFAAAFGAQRPTPRGTRDGRVDDDPGHRCGRPGS